MLKVRDFLASAETALKSRGRVFSCEPLNCEQTIDNQGSAFSGYSEVEARAIAVRLCEEVLGVKSHQWILDPSMEVPPLEEARLSEFLRRLCSGEPLQYVLGYTDFCGFRFNVGSSVLIPRPETEELCRLVVRECGGWGVPFPEGEVPQGSHRSVGDFKGLRIMDLCTGSGCIAWTLALLLPGSEVFGIDVSEEALTVARTQPLAEEAGCRGTIVPQFIRADILSFSSAFLDGMASDSGESPSSAVSACSAGDFDIIVSNPPYVRQSEREALPENVKNHEPDLALFVSDDDPLIFYRAIANFSMKRLRTGGFGFVEINEAMGEPTAAIFSSSGFSSVRLLRDFRAKFRFVVFKK